MTYINFCSFVLSLLIFCWRSSYCQNCAYPKTLIATGSNYSTIFVNDVSKGESRCYRILKGHTAPVTKVIFSSDGTKLFSSSKDGTIKLWDIETGTLIRDIYTGKPVKSFDLSPEYEKIAVIFVEGGRDYRKERTRVLILNKSGSDSLSTSEWDYFKEFNTSLSWSTRIRFSPYENCVFVSGWNVNNGYTLDSYYINEGKLNQRIGGTNREMHSFVFTSDNNLIANFGIKYLNRWSLSTLSQLSRVVSSITSNLDDYLDELSQGCISVGENYYLNFVQKIIYVFDLVKKTFIKSFSAGLQVTALKFTKDGKYLISSHFKDQISIWSVGTWESVLNVSKVHTGDGSEDILDLDIGYFCIKQCNDNCYGKGCYCDCPTDFSDSVFNDRPCEQKNGLYGPNFSACPDCKTCKTGGNNLFLQKEDYKLREEPVSEKVLNIKKGNLKFVEKQYNDKENIDQTERGRLKIKNKKELTADS